MSTVPRINWREDGTDAGTLLQAIYSQSLETHGNCDVQDLQDGDVLGWDSDVRKWRNYPNGQGNLQSVDGGTF